MVSISVLHDGQFCCLLMMLMSVLAYLLYQHMIVRARYFGLCLNDQRDPVSYSNLTPKMRPLPQQFNSQVSGQNHCLLFIQRLRLANQRPGSVGKKNSKYCFHNTKEYGEKSTSEQQKKRKKKYQEKRKT